MFYSHQLLARKAPLGQIWMAATMHAKINRKKLDKLDLIQICEEILNPSVPMALRLSGILMGGVVIVYEKKVKLLYDDVTRLMIEINEAWKVKTVPDPTVLPKGKNQARREAVTLPDNQETDVGDIEQTLNYSYPAASMGFQQGAYFAMRFDDLEEPQIHNNPEEADMGQQFHQELSANVEDITLFEQYSSYQANIDPYDRFERFDIDGEDETQLNFFNSGEGADIPNAPIPSPPNQNDNRASETPRETSREVVNDHGNQNIEGEQNKQRPRRRKPRTAAFLMDYEQTIVPGHVYQSWLQDASDLVSSLSGGRKRKGRRTNMSTTKISKLMEIPPTFLGDALSDKWDGNVPYSKPLQELWRKSTQTLNSSGSPSAAAARGRRSSSSPQANTPNHNQTEYHFEDFNNGGDFQQFPAPPERLRTDRLHEDVSIENLMARVQANLTGGEFGAADPSVMVTPGQSGDDVRSIPSSASGRDVLSSNSDLKSKRSNKKRPFSSSENGNIGLEPVAEEFTWHHPDPNFRLSTLAENVPTPDHELLVETGPTQTQRPVFTHSDERITESIQKQMKTHFETPGSAQQESINKLAVGMNRKAAAMLFYQTLVLATRDVLKVEQSQPYGDIFISRGSKM